MDIRTAFPSKYLEAADVPTDAVVTIRRLSIEEVGQDKKPRPIVFFDGVAKGMCLNKTNANTIAAIYGFETDGWIGKPITVYATETEFQGTMKPCLRVRSAAPVVGLPVSADPPTQNIATPPASATTAAPSTDVQPQSDLAAILRGET